MIHLFTDLIKDLFKVLIKDLFSDLFKIILRIRLDEINFVLIEKINLIILFDKLFLNTFLLELYTLNRTEKKQSFFQSEHDYNFSVIRKIKKVLSGLPVDESNKFPLFAKKKKKESVITNFLINNSFNHSSILCICHWIHTPKILSDLQFHH